MWRLTRYLYAFAAGQAFEVWLNAKLERPSFADTFRRAGEKLDVSAVRLERWLDERDA
jgi:hypothetical protein